MILHQNSARVLATAWPLILANAAVPMLGLIDTAAIGNWGRPADLAALALSVVVFNFLFWSFGFLRMSTTGFVAQAAGGGLEQEIETALLRAATIALALGACLVLGQAVWMHLAFELLQASEAVEAGARSYFQIRVWGAPATLLLYVVTGALIGLGKTRQLLLLQLGLTAVNALADWWLVAVFGMGVEGVAVGTVAAEWLAAALGVALLGRLLPSLSMPTVAGLGRSLTKTAVSKMLAVNSDLFVRSFFLLLSFAWFTNQSAAFGDTALAASHILLGFISFCAFFLDGFAFVAEAEVGRSIGRNSYSDFKQAARVTTAWALVAALLLSGALYAVGPNLIGVVTANPAVSALARQMLPWAIIYILCSVAAFQLDGIFIGATAAGPMRDASLMAFAVFLGAWWASRGLQLEGLWLSFVVYVCSRAVCLAAYFPRLIRLFER